MQTQTHHVEQLPESDSGSGLSGLGLAGKVPPLSHGGDVGSVVGEHRFEHVAGFGEIGSVGDDVDAGRGVDRQR